MDLGRFMKLPHRIILKKEMTRYQRATYFIEMPELTGCVAKGTTISEAVENIKKAKMRWTDSQLSAGKEVPLPVQDTLSTEFSGAFTEQEQEEYYREIKKPFKLDKKICAKYQKVAYIVQYA